MLTHIEVIFSLKWCIINFTKHIRLEPVNYQRLKPGLLSSLLPTTCHGNVDGDDVYGSLSLST